jgi:hypothetical protein
MGRQEILAALLLLHREKQAVLVQFSNRSEE